MFACECHLKIRENFSLYQQTYSTQTFSPTHNVYYCFHISWICSGVWCSRLFMIMYYHLSQATPCSSFPSSFPLQLTILYGNCLDLNGFFGTKIHLSFNYIHYKLFEASFCSFRTLTFPQPLTVAYFKSSSVPLSSLCRPHSLISTFPPQIFLRLASL